MHTCEQAGILNSPVNRRQTVVVAVLMMGLVPLSAADVPAALKEPPLIVAPGMPDDLQHLARIMWHRFVRAFPARARCLDAITVDGEWKLHDRAYYDPDRRLVTVRIPGTAPNLAASLVHEFAHHLEFTCPEQVEFRHAFLLAQGLKDGSPWWEGATWEQTPSEQFAEAVAEYVLRERPTHATTTTTERALKAIRHWATVD